MKATLKRHLPVILLILFEIAVGVLLLTNPEAFTNAVIIIFGAVCVVIGLIYFFKYLRARKREDASVLMLIGAIFSLTLGLFSIIASPLIITFFTFIAIMYAVIMLVSGLIKIQNYIINPLKPPTFSGCLSELRFSRKRQSISRRLSMPLYSAPTR